MEFRFRKSTSELNDKLLKQNVTNGKFMSVKIYRYVASVTTDSKDVANKAKFKLV
ncbi:hypothetical protein AB9M75_03420 [Lactobacillus sp. AN1001]